MGNFIMCPDNCLSTAARERLSSVVVYVCRLASTKNNCLLRVGSRRTGPHWITGVGRGVYNDGGKIRNTCRHIVCLTTRVVCLFARACAHVCVY